MASMMIYKLYEKVSTCPLSYSKILDLDLSKTMANRHNIDSTILYTDVGIFQQHA